jgi:hypothetical protein
MKNNLFAEPTKKEQSFSFNKFNTNELAQSKSSSKLIKEIQEIK